MKWEDDCIQLARIWKEAVIVSLKALSKSNPHSQEKKNSRGYPVTWRYTNQVSPGCTSSTLWPQ